ncbi:MAG: ATP-dependent nuclease [Candidatus Njordarchaeales archaeon]
MNNKTVRLSGISIRNFRGIKEADIQGFSDINVFIGRNGAGKSTLLEAIYLASAFVNEKDPLTSESRINTIIKRRTDRGAEAEKDILWYSLDTQHPIQLILFFTSEKRMYLEYIYQSPLDRVWICLDKIREKIRDIPSGCTHFNYPSARLWNIKTNTSSTNSSFKNAFFEVFKEEIEFLNNVIIIDEKLLRHPEVLERRIWPRILAKRLDKMIVKIIRKSYEEGVEDLSYVPMSGGYYLVLKLPDTFVRVDDLGDGARIAILLAAYLLLVKNTIVLIEDPEIHQHPGGLFSILEFISEVAKSNNLQVFMTTHSLELIRLIKKIAEEKGLDLRIFFLEREDGIVYARIIESVDFDIIQNLGIDPRFLDLF